MFGCVPDLDHLGGQDAGGAVEGRERLVELGHVAADRRLALDQVDREAGVGELEGGLIPAMPPPTTSVAGLIGTRIGSSGACSPTR